MNKIHVNLPCSQREIFESVLKYNRSYKFCLLTFYWLIQKSFPQIWYHDVGILLSCVFLLFLEFLGECLHFFSFTEDTVPHEQTLWLCNISVHHMATLNPFSLRSGASLTGLNWLQTTHVMIIDWLCRSRGLVVLRTQRGWFSAAALDYFTICSILSPYLHIVFYLENRYVINNCSTCITLYMCCIYTYCIYTFIWLCV